MSASNYEQLSDHQKQVGQELVTVSAVKKGEKVLDLGCGTGHFAAILSELVGPEGKIIAIDPDVDRIKLAKEKNARANIEYLVENDQTFPGDNYDLVFSNHVIHWIKDKEALFKRLHEKMSSGGRFAFLTFPQAPYFSPVMSKAFSELISLSFEQNLLYEQQRFEGPNTYRHFAESAGFEVISVKIKQFTTKWTSLNNFIKYFHGVSHGDFDLSSLDKDAVRSFREKHEEDLVSQTVSRDLLYMLVAKR